LGGDCVRPEADQFINNRRFSEEQIIGFLKEADAGVPVVELCRKHGFSDASYYKWKAKFGGMDVSDAKRLRAWKRRTAS
jgi:putative transposase